LKSTRADIFETESNFSLLSFSVQNLRKITIYFTCLRTSETFQTQWKFDVFLNVHLSIDLFQLPT